MVLPIVAAELLPASTGPIWPFSRYSHGDFIRP
jgi:hypothetical protein